MGTLLPMSSPDTNHPLRRALADWRVQPTRDPHFRAAVWRRLEAARRPSTWARFARSHPAAVGGLLMVAVVLGAFTGRTEARHRTDADRLAIAADYVHSLDARWLRNP